MHDGVRHKNKVVYRMTCRNGFWYRFLFLHRFEIGFPAPVHAYVVLIKPSWQMFLEVPARHEKSS